MTWWWLSFVEPNAPKGRQFRGIALVETPEEQSDLATAREAVLALFPDAAPWSPMGKELPDLLLPPARFRKRMLRLSDPAEAEDMGLVRQHITARSEQMAAELSMQERYALVAIASSRIAGLRPGHPQEATVSYGEFLGADLHGLAKRGLATSTANLDIPGAPVGEPHHEWRITPLGEYVQQGALQIAQRQFNTGRHSA